MTLAFDSWAAFPTRPTNHWPECGHLAVACLFGRLVLFNQCWWLMTRQLSQSRDRIPAHKMSPGCPGQRCWLCLELNSGVSLTSTMKLLWQRWLPVGESRTCWQRIRRCLELLLPLWGSTCSLSGSLLSLIFFLDGYFFTQCLWCSLWALGEHMQALLSLNLLLQAYVTVATKSILVKWHRKHRSKLKNPEVWFGICSKVLCSFD